LDDPYRLLVATVKDYAIFLLDPDGIILSWNAGAQRLKGYEAAEIIGRHFSVVYPQEAIERRWPQHELQEAAKEGRFEDEGWRLRKDGSLFWANVLITALRDERGGLRGFSKVTRDLTERRQAEQSLRESEELFRLLIEGVKDYAIFMLGPDGRVRSWNTGAQRIKGYAAAEIIGQHFSIFYPSDAKARKWPDHELAVARESGRYEEEGLRVRKDGTTFWADVVITPVYDRESRLIGYAKVTRDLTDRRRVEALENAERQSTEFLAMLAHELRNPLAPIRNALQLLETKPTTDSAELWVREVLQRQTAQMARLVDDLLDVSRITRSSMVLNRKPIDMRTVVRSAIDGSVQWMQGSKHSLEVAYPEERLEIDADEVRMTQVMQNLLHNAAKFTPEGGRITVRATREAEHAVVSVKDNGVGMSAELLKSAFVLFKQASQSLDRPHGGLGVGLALVQRLVQLHGGTVTAQSEGTGRGSEFVVRLPLCALRPEGPEPTKPLEAQAPTTRTRRVLIVDDNFDAGQALLFLLQNEGHDVRLATDGAAGLVLARSFKPQVMLLDIGMPQLDGYQLASRIRADNELRNATIVAITGYGQKHDRDRSAAAGFDHHFTKPVEFEALKKLLQAVP
jgi:PAS domain S-box-containing protein